MQKLNYGSINVNPSHVEYCVCTCAYVEMNNSLARRSVMFTLSDADMRANFLWLGGYMELDFLCCSELSSFYPFPNFLPCYRVTPY